MTFRNLTCKRLQVDEIWSFVYAKAKNVMPRRPVSLASVTFGPLPRLTRTRKLILPAMAGVEAGYGRSLTSWRSSPSRKASPGAIYLTARIYPFGRQTPDGTVLQTNRDVRRWVLEAAGRLSCVSRSPWPPFRGAL